MTVEQGHPKWRYAFHASEPVTFKMSVVVLYYSNGYTQNECIRSMAIERVH
jgi:hypothetical protein